MKRKYNSLRFITIAIAAVFIGIVISNAVTASAEADEIIAQADAFIESQEEGNGRMADNLKCNYSYSDPVLAGPESDDQTESRFTAEEEMILALMVWGEIAHCDQAADYYGAYLQTCVALNRLDQGWSDTLTGVVYQDGQFCPEYYETLLYYGDLPNDLCWMAVRDAIAYNDTPDGLVFADCRDVVPEGCWIYYESPTGQRFYCTY